MAKFEKNQSGKRLTKIMTDSYMSQHQRAVDGAFVVWIAIIVPAEIFLGFENVVWAVPESHAAMCAGRGVGVKQCQKAEDKGYSMDLCSYARIDLGTVFSGGEDSPSLGLPMPNLIVSDNNNCSLLAKWFDVHRRMLSVPHFKLDVPFCYGNQKKEDTLYIKSQLQDLIETIEKMSGQKFDEDRFAQAIAHTHEGFTHWKRFMDLAAHKPSGITVFDSFVQMAPFFTDRGTERFAEHYRLLADETEELVQNGRFPVPNEKYRLMWDNIAPWHQLRKMSKRLAELGANIVAAPYTSCIGAIEGDFSLYEYDGKDPLWHAARCQNTSVCPHGLNLRVQAMGRAIDQLDIDGAVFASNRSCKVFSLMQMDQQKQIAANHDIPTVMIDVDHADERKYSEEAAFTRLEALLEQIDQKRAA